VTAATATVRRTPARQRTRRLTTDNVIASTAVTLLTAVTAIGMCRVFGDWAFLRPLLVITLVVHAACMALRVLRVPAFLALPALAVVIYELVALLLYRDTMSAFLPSRDTLELLRLDLRIVWAQFPEATAPVPSDGPYLVAAAFGVGIVAVLSDAFAFRAYGRVEAVVPAGVLFIFTAALGTDRNRIAVAAFWFATAILVIAMLRALHSGTDDSWLGRRGRAMGAAIPATVMCAGVAALAAAAIGPLLPGAGEEPLLDTRNGDGEVTEVVSPLVDIRSRLVSQRVVEMFVVDSPAKRYWRVSGLSDFNGTQWGFQDAQLEDASGLLREPSATSQVVEQRFTMSRYGGRFIPSAFKPVSIEQDSVQWLPNNDTFVLDVPATKPGDVFTVVADIARPSADVLRALSADSPPSDDFLALPSNFPEDAAALAREVTGTATTPYDRAQMLQNFFHTFTYDLEVQRGHSNDAILSFLRLRRGYCEQFAGTYAAMARSLGLPARVAVGFTPGELQADGRYHVYGRHAHAWPEVWFDDVGWVAFEPTPGRGEPGNESITGVAPQQDDTPTPVGTGTPSDAPAQPQPTVPVPFVPTIPEPVIDPTPSDTLPEPVPVGGSSSSGGGPSKALWIFLGILAIGTWMLVMPRAVRRFTRRGRSPAEQVVQAWHATVGALVMAGAPAPAGSTPLEYAVRIERELGVDHRSLHELARFVTRAIYSPSGVGEPAAMRAAVLRTQLEETARDMMPWYTRLLGRLDPRLVRQRLVG
jgi:transglutaminase-like putative cysteine protease